MACELCGDDRLVSPKEARMVYPGRVGDWGVPLGDESLGVICTYCHGFRYAGEWCRERSVFNRALELAQSGSKSLDEYKEKMDDAPKPGEDPGEDTRPAAADATEW